MAAGILMIDGMPLIDTHLHVARKPTLKLPWETWAQGFAGRAVARLMPYEDTAAAFLAGNAARVYNLKLEP